MTVALTSESSAATPKRKRCPSDPTIEPFAPRLDFSTPEKDPRAGFRSNSVPPLDSPRDSVANQFEALEIHSRPDFAAAADRRTRKKPKTYDDGEEEARRGEFTDSAVEEEDENVKAMLANQNKRVSLKPPPKPRFHKDMEIAETPQPGGGNAKASRRPSTREMSPLPIRSSKPSQKRLKSPPPRKVSDPKTPSPAASTGSSKSETSTSVSTPPSASESLTTATHGPDTIIADTDTATSTSTFPFDFDISSSFWQDSEITGHLFTDPDDDGYGMNGIGFKATPALAWARSQRRRQQVQEWRAREAREERRRRALKRNAISGSSGKNGGDGKRSVRFASQ
ncbi:hypothetical protein K402DRAFT_396005 [Aulographum hederae CBS 113979]|uniref:Uncharacterized protein n=1 Tax=Aulographum hederae CBS 113979 TaxID=1176131 RepID=A0A6G1GTD6_9PEZI|nr:hypothetical protein K402DRAFT_396005 [Aulographum hederae CBS 113979]